MLKRMFLCLLCLLMISSACPAEELPAQAYTCKISLLPEIPEETMKTVFAAYMVPGCEAEYCEGFAWCPSLIMSGEGWYPSPRVAEDNERIRNCREIAEKLLHAVYPDEKPELVTAMSYRAYLEWELKTRLNFELKDGQWNYLEKPITPEMEETLKTAGLSHADDRARMEAFDPSWTILHYHSGNVCGLPVGWQYDAGNTFAFIFNGENQLVSVMLGRSFATEPVKEASVRISREEALQLAREHAAKQQGYDWRGYVGDPYDDLLKELGYSSIRSEMVSEDEVRPVMVANDKGQLQPAWECLESFRVIADGEVIQEHFQGPMAFFLSAEDGTPLE